MIEPEEIRKKKRELKVLKIKARIYEWSLLIISLLAVILIILKIWR